MHPGTTYASQYFGYMWWDNETDGERMYPANIQDRGSRTTPPISLLRNPEAASLKGNWSDPEFLRNVRDLNTENQQTQFADFHGHGWVFRAVYKHDRKGNWLDKDDRKVDFNDPEEVREGRPPDRHPSRKRHALHRLPLRAGQPRQRPALRRSRAPPSRSTASIATAPSAPRATLKTSGTAAPDRRPRSLAPAHAVRHAPLRMGRRQARAALHGGREQVEWAVSQVLDSITPGSPNYNEKSRLAKTMQHDGTTWGSAAPSDKLAHSDERMTCYTCHTSWMTSCFGCHLSMKSQRQPPMLHNEGDVDDAQLHQLQLPGAARRHLHAGHGQHGEEEPDRARAQFAAPSW